MAHNDRAWSNQRLEVASYCFLLWEWTQGGCDFKSRMCFAVKSQATTGNVKSVTISLYNMENTLLPADVEYRNEKYYSLVLEHSVWTHSSHLHHSRFQGQDHKFLPFVSRFLPSQPRDGQCLHSHIFSVLGNSFSFACLLAVYAPPLNACLLSTHSDFCFSFFSWAVAPSCVWPRSWSGLELRKRR